MSSNLDKKIGKATVWSSMTEIAAKLISPIVNMVLARLLAPEAFGIVATITMVISFAEVFTDAGFQKYIIQHEFENDEELNKSTNVAFWTNLSISTLICILIFIFRDGIAVLVGSPGLGGSISIASLLIIIAAFSSIQMARYKRDFDFKSLFYVRIGTALIPLVVTIPLALWLKNYWALLIGTLATQLFTAVVLTVRSKWKPKFYYSFALLREMFGFSAWTLLESISIWATSNIGIFVVGTQLNEHYLGLYKISMSTINSYMAIITSAITPVLFSALSRYQSHVGDFRKTYFSFQKLAAVLLMPMGVGILIFRELVTDILLGSQWAEASTFIGLWGLSSAFSILLSTFASEVYRSKGKPKISLIAQLIHLAFLVPILWICAQYGFEVLYIARVLLRVQLILTALLFMHFIFGFKIHEVFTNILPQTVSALIMGAAGFGLISLGDYIILPAVKRALISSSLLPTQLSSAESAATLIWQLLAVLLCIVIYFTVLFVFFPNLRRETLATGPAKKILKLLRIRTGAPVTNTALQLADDAVQADSLNAEVCGSEPQEATAAADDATATDTDCEE